MRHHGGMAGGMNKRGSWGPMTDRVDRGREPNPTVATAEQPPAALKHCWVTDRHGRLPGLLLEWRRTESGFQGRVLRAVHEQDTGWLVVEEWLPAELLEGA
jgi:hypothetical protein